MTNITSLDIFIGATFDSFDKMAEETISTYNKIRSYYSNGAGSSTYLDCEVNDVNWWMSLYKTIKVPDTGEKIRQRYVSVGLLDTGDNKDLTQAELFKNHHVESIFIYLDDKLSKEDVRRIYLHFEEVAVCDNISFSFVDTDDDCAIHGDVAAVALEGEV